MVTRNCPTELRLKCHQMTYFDPVEHNEKSCKPGTECYLVLTTNSINSLHVEFHMSIIQEHKQLTQKEVAEISNKTEIYTQKW